MVSVNPRIEKAIQSFESEHSAMLEEVNNLYEALNNLQYEGTVFIRRNVRNIFRIVRSIKKGLFPHMQFDDDKIFPFLQSHIPRYEPIFAYLKAEHAEIRAEFKVLEAVSADLEKAKTRQGEQKLVVKLRDHGIYLVCLIRNHLRVEGENVNKVMRRLNSKEQNILLAKLKLHP